MIYGVIPWWALVAAWLVANLLLIIAFAGVYRRGG